MTTLPSTTAIRLPREPQQPASHLAPVHGPHAPQQAGALTGADAWRVIRGNIWWILGSTVVALVLGFVLYLYVKQTSPKWRSVAFVLVNKPVRINPVNSNSIDQADANSDFNLPIEQRTQSTMLMSEALWDDVLQKSSKIRETTWFRNFVARSKNSTDAASSPVKLAKDDLSSNFRATLIPDSKLVQVSMDSASPTDSRDIVQEIVGQHIENQQQQTFDRTNQELNTATQWKDRYIKLEAQTKAAMNDIINRVGSGSSPASMNRLNIKELQVSQLVSQQATARMKATDAQSMLESLQQQLNAGTDPTEVELAVKSDPSVQRLQAMVDDLDVRIEAQTASYGAKSHFVDDLISQRDVARKKLQQANSSTRAIARSMVLDRAKAEFASAKAAAASIDSQIDSLRNELGEISANIADYLSLKDEYDGYKELERQMTERVAVLQNALRQQVASVSWSSMPTLPDTLSSPSLKVYLPVAFLLGLGLSVGIAFLRELSNTAVRSPRDITRVGPINLLGMIAIESDDPKAAGVPMHTVISQAPASMIAEQFRQVRTRLQHTASLDTTRTFVVTSAGPGDGKTMIACNLATGLALNGRRILLVDANFKRPALHTLYGVSNDAGFSTVLDAVGKLETAVKKTEIPNLEILPNGPRAANPTEMLESQLFSDFIDRALEEYDHVIFDAGPLLVVSEAVALAPRCDGVITVVRARKNTRGMLTRVRETLRHIKAEHLGVVLNGVQTWGGGYYARNIKTYYAYQDEA